MDSVSCAFQLHPGALPWAITAAVRATARAPSTHSISVVLPCAPWERSRTDSALRTWYSTCLISWRWVVVCAARRRRAGHCHLERLQDRAIARADLVAFSRLNDAYYRGGTRQLARYGAVPISLC